MTLSRLGGDPEEEQAILIPFPPGWGLGGWRASVGGVWAKDHQCIINPHQDDDN